MTKMGLEDLKNGVVRTPLDPHKTFMDDPLRILRAFRFSSRYDFKIEHEAYQVIKDDEEIKKSFIKKISRERIGKELASNFDL